MSVDPGAETGRAPEEIGGAAAPAPRTSLPAGWPAGDRAALGPVAREGTRDPGTPSAAGELLRAVGALGAVLAVAAAALWLLDGVPALLSGEARSVRTAASVRDAESALNARLVLPAYFPQSLSWPPASVRYVVGPPSAVALTLGGEARFAPVLFAQVIGDAPVPAELLPGSTLLDRSSIAVGSATGTLSRLLQDGHVTWEVAWSSAGRRLVLRARGEVDELLRMARSAREVR